MFSRAVDWELLDQSPMKGIKFFRRTMLDFVISRLMSVSSS